MVDIEETVLHNILHPAEVCYLPHPQRRMFLSRYIPDVSRHGSKALDFVTRAMLASFPGQVWHAATKILLGFRVHTIMLILKASHAAMHKVATVPTPTSGSV
jgi:hypothetical protein